MLLRGERVVLRPGTEDDLDALEAFFAAPEVARWWPMDGRDRDREGRPRPGGSGRHRVRHRGGRDGGRRHPERRGAGGGLPVRRASTSRSLPSGTAPAWPSTRSARSPGTSSTTAATTASRSIRTPPTDGPSRAYTKLGFQPVGILRQYERARRRHLARRPPHGPPGRRAHLLASAVELTFAGGTVSIDVAQPPSCASTSGRPGSVELMARRPGARSRDPPVGPAGARGLAPSGRASGARGPAPVLRVRGRAGDARGLTGWEHDGTLRDRLRRSHGYVLVLDESRRPPWCWSPTSCARASSWRSSSTSSSRSRCGATWLELHAASVVIDGRAHLVDRSARGPARRRCPWRSARAGGGLLGNDRAFVRPGRRGGHADAREAAARHRSPLFPELAWPPAPADAFMFTIDELAGMAAAPHRRRAADPPAGGGRAMPRRARRRGRAPARHAGVPGGGPRRSTGSSRVPLAPDGGRASAPRQPVPGGERRTRAHRVRAARRRPPAGAAPIWPAAARAPAPAHRVRLGARALADPEPHPSVVEVGP